jgi:hypothetical protein
VCSGVKNKFHLPTIEKIRFHRPARDKRANLFILKYFRHSDTADGNGEDPYLFPPEYIEKSRRQQKIIFVKFSRRTEWYAMFEILAWDCSYWCDVFVEMYRWSPGRAISHRAMGQGSGP